MHVAMDAYAFSSDSDDEDYAPPNKKKKVNNPLRKWSGAAIYKSKYQTSWQRKWPFLTPVKEIILTHASVLFVKSKFLVLTRGKEMC